MPERMTGSGRRRAHMAPLTSLRFFAALYVVLFHTAPVSFRAHALVDRFAAGGYIGVSFFFVLSGFVLGWNYLERFSSGTIRPVEFWRARVARVYPVYVLGLLVSAPYFVYGLLREQRPRLVVAGEAARQALSVLSLTQAWMPRYALVWNAPSWSLSVEAFFYALFPLLAIAILMLPRRRLGLAMAAAWLATLMAPAVYLLVRPDGAVYPQYNVSDLYWLDAMRYLPIAHLSEFVMGLLGARWLLDRRMRGQSAGQDVTWPVIGLAVLATALVMFAADPLYPFLHDGLLAPLFIGIILLLADGRGRLVRLLSHPMLVLFGEASYALYLLHVPVGDWLSIVGKHVGLTLNPGASAGAFALYVPLVVAVSVLTLRYVEEPARRAIREGRLAVLPWRLAAVPATTGPES